MNCNSIIKSLSSQVNVLNTICAVQHSELCCYLSAIINSIGSSLMIQEIVLGMLELQQQVKLNLRELIKLAVRALSVCYSGSVLQTFSCESMRDLLFSS